MGAETSYSSINWGTALVYAEDANATDRVDRESRKVMAHFLVFEKDWGSVGSFVTHFTRKGSVPVPEPSYDWQSMSQLAGLRLNIRWPKGMLGRETLVVLNNAISQ